MDQIQAASIIAAGINAIVFNVRLFLKLDELPPEHELHFPVTERQGLSVSTRLLMYPSSDQNYIHPSHMFKQEIHLVIS